MNNQARLPTHIQVKREGDPCKTDVLGRGTAGDLNKFFYLKKPDQELWETADLEQQLAAFKASFKFVANECQWKGRHKKNLNLARSSQDFDRNET